MVPTGIEKNALRFGGRVDDRRDTAARLEDAVDLAERALPVGEIDQPDPGDHGVEGVVGELERLGVHLARCDVGEAGLPGGIGGVVEDHGRDVRCEHAAVGPGATCRGDRLTAGAGREVEHLGSSADTGPVEHAARSQGRAIARGSAPSGSRPLPPPATAAGSSACRRWGRTWSSSWPCSSESRVGARVSALPSVPATGSTLRSLARRIIGRCP